MTREKKKKREPRDEEIVIGRHRTTDKKSKKSDVADKPRKKNGTVDGRSDRTPERAKSKLERRQKRLDSALEEIDIEAISRNVQPGEREYLEEYVWMFNRIGRLIRTTEKRALKSGQSKDVYALSTLISQQREIIADIRMLADSSGQVSMLKDGVLQPLVSSVAQNLLDTYYHLRRLITETSNPKETQFALRKLEEIVRDQSKFVQVKYHEASDNVDRVMAGEPLSSGVDEAPKKKKKKKKGG